MAVLEEKGPAGMKPPSRLAQARTAARTASSGEAQGAALQTLAFAALDAYEASGRLALLDEAVAAAEASLRATAPASDAYAARANDYGFLLRQRYDARHQEADLWRAESALRTAVLRTPQRDPDWAGRAGNLANVLVELYELTDTRGLLDEAVRLLEEAIDRVPPGVPDPFFLPTSLSRTLRIRYGETRDRRDVERSVDLDEQALATIPPGHPDRVLLLGNAANGQSQLSRARDAHWRRAVALWREAYQAGAEQQPAAALGVCLNWLTGALTHGAAQDATDAAVFGQRVLDTLVAAQQHRTEQGVWLGQAANLPLLAARVYVEAGSPERAVLAVEHARAALLTATLASADGGPPVTVEQLHRVARTEGPLVYLVPGHRAMALTVDADGVSVLPLPALTQDAVWAAVSDLYTGYYHRRADGEGWRKAFDKVTRWLWTAVMAPLLRSLRGHRRVNLLPGGLLALLPLHAAWEPASRTATGRRYAGDGITITWQATAKLLLRPPPAAGAGAGQEELVTVAEPRPTSRPRLRWAVAETHAARAACAGSSGIREFAHEDAQGDLVLPALARAQVIHLACHGEMELEDPLAGGLVLAHDQVLTVGMVLDTRLRARLVVASACESGSLPPDLADQVVNLAAALLHAGSHAVLATSFVVDDFAALVLATQFYAEWRTGTPGAQALHAAIAFLRDTTKAEKLGWVGELRRAGWPADVTESLAAGLALASDQSFAHPVQWAPFMWWGSNVRA